MAKCIKFMFVLTAELERLMPSVAQVYDDDAEPNVVTTLTYFQSMVLPILNQSEMDSNLEEAQNEDS